MSPAEGAWDEVRQLVPEVLGALVRRHGDFQACEDSVQEALLAAAEQWPRRGWPANPAAWLTTVATRRHTDRVRSETARRRRELAEVRHPGAGTPVHVDDTLTVLALCCHPALTRASQVALTLRAVGGLTTAEVARAFTVPEATAAQRISRAKQRLRDVGAGFGLPPPGPERSDRVRAVLPVLYLLFTEGHTATSGPDLVRVDLTSEALRLARQVHGQVPDDGEVAGLLALMLLADARRTARVGPRGELVPLAEQDRSRWDAARIAEGVDLVTRSLATNRVGPYQVQAAIAAVHSEARRDEDTDWPQVLALYGLLERLAPSPVVTVNRAVAVAMVEGPEAGLAVLDGLDDRERAGVAHRVASVRAHLLERAGRTGDAVAAYADAARRARTLPERRHLAARGDRLSAGRPAAAGPSAAGAGRPSRD